jgi:hypothetical protein
VLRIFKLILPQKYEKTEYLGNSEKKGIPGNQE